MTAVDVDALEAARAAAVAEIAALASVPVSRVGRPPLVAPGTPCFCSPETRALHTHRPTCPWGDLGEELR